MSPSGDKGIHTLPKAIIPICKDMRHHRYISIVGSNSEKTSLPLCHGTFPCALAMFILLPFGMVLKRHEVPFLHDHHAVQPALLSGDFREGWEEAKHASCSSQKGVFVTFCYIFPSEISH